MTTENNAITVPLSRSYDDGTGERFNSLTFREPTGAEIQRIGMPVLINPEKRNIDFTDSMGPMMATLASVPPSVIGRLSGQDWSTCAYAIAPFFLPTAGTSSGSRTSSPNTTARTRASSSKTRSRR